MDEVDTGREFADEFTDAAGAQVLWISSGVMMGAMRSGCWMIFAQAGIIVAIRRRFSAAHTSRHSALALVRPRMLNWRKPNTFFTQPLGG